MWALAGSDEDAAALWRRTFDRARLTSALFARLGFDGRTACCDGASRWPDLAVEPAAPAAPTQGPAQPFAAFFPECGGCHATGETSPPNFLAGSGAQVAARLRPCAPRLYVRLAMWHRDPPRSEEHTSELQSLMRITYAVFCLTKTNIHTLHNRT